MAVLALFSVYVRASLFKIESVGYKYADLATMTKRYDPARLVEGYNTMPDGEKIFYISNPVLREFLLMSSCLPSTIPVPSTLAPTSCTRPLVCGRTKSASKDLLVSHPRVRQLQQRRQSLAKKDSLTRLRVRVAIKKDRKGSGQHQ